MVKNKIVLLDPYSNALWGGGGYRRINISSLRITITKVLYLYNWIWSSILNKYKEFERRWWWCKGQIVFLPLADDNNVLRRW